MENDNYTINSDNNITNNTTKDTSAFRNTSKSPKNPTLIGTICGITGLIIGGISIFCIMQFIKQQPPVATDCLNCECPKCKVGDNNLLSSINTSFLALEPKNQNLIYSPLSIRYGLSLLNTGAAGTTKAEIEEVLGNEPLPKYENVTDTLSLANAIFIRNTFAEYVLPSYTSAVQNNYNAEVLYDDFSSTTNMDDWVSQKTFGLINQIGLQVGQGTQMVLANALAIQMDWQHKFDADDTQGQSFYKQDGEEVEATTMTELTHADDIKYYTDDSITMLSMPLEQTSTGVNLDFVAVMPESGLDSYIDNLNMDSIEEAITNSIPASTPEDGVRIYIPKFKYDYELKFKDDLYNLGITQAFTDSAEFPAISSEYPLKVSDAIHKANIDFSEDGIKAAAITVFGLQEATAIDEDRHIPEPIIIDIDHPFLFLIRDRADGTIWFIGTVYEPNLWADDSTDYTPTVK